MSETRPCVFPDIVLPTETLCCARAACFPRQGLPFFGIGNFCDLKISIEKKCTLLTMLVVLHVTLDGRDGHLKPLIHLGESTGDNSRRGGTP